MKAVVMASLIAGFVGAVIGASVVIAVPQAARVGYVTVPQVIASTPEGQGIRKVEDARRKELKPLTDQLQKLQPKMRAGSATFDEREQYKKLIDKYNTINKKYDTQFNQLIKPFDQRLRASISASAKAQGYSLIVDGVIALDSGLLLYSDKTVADLTPFVVKEFKKRP
jgi:Skp family chaperone for outer membrane proteins